MKKTKSNKNKKILLISILLIVCAVIFYFVAIRDTSPTDNVAKQQGAENVAQQSKDSVSSQNTASKDGSTSNSNVEPPKSTGQLSGSSLTISSFSQSGGYVRATATVNNNNTGTCYFGFSSSDTKPVSRSNQSQSQSGNQLCTVEIPEVEFTKLGTWHMVISFTQNEAKTEASQDVTIN